MLFEKNTLTQPQDLLDKLAIKEIVEFERYCRDNALWDQMASCFIEDSLVDISWFNGTGQAFVEASKAMGTRAPHKIYNTLVWVKGDKGVAVMQSTIQTRFTYENEEMTLNSDAKLIFRTVKIGDLWFIKSLECIYEQDSIIPVLPACQVTLPQSLLSGKRESYKCLTFVLESAGYHINSDLAGIDKPETVAAITQKLNAWLEA